VKPKPSTSRAGRRSRRRRCEAAQIDGVSRVLTVDQRRQRARASPQVLAPQIARLAAGYTHVFGPSTTFGKDLMPRVAALLGVAQVSDVMA
jgi:electron transfer flavoprotein alpha subunit